MSQSIETNPSVPPRTAEAARVSALDGALLHGIAWTGGVKWASQLVTWVATLLVARLLTPNDYGLVGMATVYLGLITLLSEFGIGATIVTLRDLSDAQVAQINTLSFLFGLTGFLVSCLVAVPLGWFFNEPQLPPVIVVLSLAFLITALRTVPYALLQRDLRFKRLAIIDGGQAILGACAMMAFAVLGLRYWTLVLGGLLSATLSTAIIVASRPHRFARPRVRSMRQAVAFSWYVLLDRFAWYSYSSADLLVAGKLLGRAPLGVYGFAATLANVPVDKVTALVGSVTTSIFSAVQNEPAALRRYLLSITEGLATVTLPATLGLAVIAPDFVLAVLGEKWAPAIVPLQLLAVNAAFRSLVPLLPQVLFVTGDARFTMWNSVRAAVLLPVAFYIGSRWGTVGIAAAWIVSYPLVAIPLYWRVFHKLGVSTTDYLGALRPSITGVALMAIAVATLGQLLPRDLPLLLRLILELAGGAAAYLAALLSLSHARLRNVYQTWKLVGS